MKKLLLAFLILPILFSVASIFPISEANATSYKLNVKVKNDTNNSKSHNDSPVDTCHNGPVKIRVTDDAGSREYSWTSQANCKGTTVKQNIGVILENGSSYRVQLLTPSGKSFNYIRLLNLSNNSDTNKTAGLTNSVVVPKGNYEVAFGIKLGSTPAPSASPKPKPKITAEYVLIDDGDFTKENGENCDVNPNTVLKINGTSKTWGNRLLNCSGAKYTFEHDGSTTVGLKIGNERDFEITGLSYYDSRSDTPGRFTIKRGVTSQSMTGGGVIRFYVKKKPASTPTPYSTILNVFVDGNKNGKKDPGENCPENTNARIKVGSEIDTTVTCTKTVKTAANSRSITLVSVSDDYVATGLTKIDEDETKTLTNGAKSIGATGTNVRVFFGVKKPGDNNDDCKRNPYTFNLNPDSKTVNKGGDEFKYDVIIKNNDSKCDPSKFTLSSSVTEPNTNWSSILGDKEFNLKSGEDKTVKLTVKSPSSAKAGVEKKINVKAKKGTQAKREKHVVYKIKDSANPSPSQSPTGNPCVRKDPEVAVTKDKNSVKPGGVIKFTVKFTNKDTGACSNKNLAISTNLPNDNWNSTFSSKNFEIAKGSDKSVTVSIDSPANAAVKTHEIPLVVKNGSGDNIMTKKLDFIVSEVVIDPTASPTTSPSPTDDPNPEPGKTNVKLTLGIDGIGSTPVVPRGNTSPVHTSRDIVVRVVQAGDNSKVIFSGPITFNFVNSRFSGTLQVSNSDIVDNAGYNIYISNPGFLNSQYPFSVKIAKNGTNLFEDANFYMTGGNINNGVDSENKLNLIDYEILIGCVVNTGAKKAACDADGSYRSISDIDDDGEVNIDDLNLFLKIRSEQRGVVIPD